MRGNDELSKSKVISQLEVTIKKNIPLTPNYRNSNANMWRISNVGYHNSDSLDHINTTLGNISVYLEELQLMEQAETDPDTLKEITKLQIFLLRSRSNHIQVLQLDEKPKAEEQDNQSTFVVLRTYRRNV